MCCRSIEEVDKLVDLHVDGGSRTAKALAALKVHRDELVTDMGDELKDAQVSHGLQLQSLSIIPVAAVS